MEKKQDSDECLMREVAGGKHEPLNTLMRRHATALLTFIQRMIGDPHRAEELFQEVFLAVWIFRRRYQYPLPFRAWLLGIAMNKCRADFRRYNPLPLPFEDDCDDCPATADPSPVETAITLETAALVEAAVSQLPAKQRAVVVMRIWNGMSYGEIADAVGRGEDTVRSRMFYGLAALRRFLEPRMK